VDASGLTRLHSLPSATGGVARLVFARLRETGLPTEALLSDAGLTVEQLENSSAKVSVRSQIRFLELGAEALHDDSLGFHLAQDYDLRQVGLLYYVMSSSETVADAFVKAERYCGIVNEGVSLRFGTGAATTISLSYVGIERRSDRQQIEFWLTSLVRMCRQLTDRRLVPSRTRVIHHRAKTPPDFKSFLGSDIEFGAEIDELAFPAAVKAMPLIGADPHLNRLLIEYCEEALAHRPTPVASLRSSVENAVAPLLPHGTARAAEIARRLGMSQRTLTRRLASEGLTLSEVLDELKAGLARNYLRTGDLPVSQIAWLLGHREVSAFTHAFKRWTGMTPREFRTQKSQAAPSSPARRPTKRSRGR
jgi:AraC-like DNA-binding protein